MLNKRFFLLIICLCTFFFVGCKNEPDTSTTEKKATETKDVTKEENTSSLPPRDNTPHVLKPEATGQTVYGNDIISIDASNISQGYFMVSYKGNNSKVRLRMAAPDETTYTFAIENTGQYDTFPFPAGNGSYTVTLLENLDGDEYIISFVQDLSVSIDNEFLPFLYPNQYVNFSSDSNAVKKASTLLGGVKTDLEAVAAIYEYVIANIEYDDDKATNVSFGYAPNVDETLETKKGICFDYASLMTAMLRSQNIPTKLGVGYAGEVYHAWISTYITDIGWIDNIIEFDGKDWALMDPTFAANSDNDALKDFIGKGDNYILKYTY